MLQKVDAKSGTVLALVFSGMVLGCSSPSAPELAGPDVTVDLILSRPFYTGETLPLPQVLVVAGGVDVTVAEWFTYGGFVLPRPKLQFGDPANRPPGTLYLNSESETTPGIGLIWRKDHVLSLRRVPSGIYRLTVRRYDPGINDSLHPQGNPRIPVDTIVTIPDRVPTG